MMHLIHRHFQITSKFQNANYIQSATKVGLEQPFTSLFVEKDDVRIDGVQTCIRREWEDPTLKIKRVAIDSFWLLGPGATE